jgi:integrase
MSSGGKQIRGERYSLTHEGFASAMERAVKKANLSGFHMCDIRRTTASGVVRGSHLKVARRLLSHSDIRTTMRYVHPHDDIARDALDSAIPTENHTNLSAEDVGAGK